MRRAEATRSGPAAAALCAVALSLGPAALGSCTWEGRRGDAGICQVRGAGASSMPRPASPTEIFVANAGQRRVSTFAVAASGDASPSRIFGDRTGLFAPFGIAVDLANDEVLVTDGDSILAYPRTADGNVIPLRVISGPAAGLARPIAVAVDTVHDEILVANLGGGGELPSCSITVHARSADGNVAPLRTLRTRSCPIDVAVDAAHDEFFVVDASEAVLAYARGATRDDPPLRAVTGASTGLHGAGGIAVDAIHDEVLVVNQFAGSVTVYPRTASGDAVPVRTLRGAATGLINPARIAVDPVNDEIFVTNRNPVGGGAVVGIVTVHGRTASGDVGASRALSGPATALDDALGIAVDAVHGELLVATFGGGCITAHERMADGNAVFERRIGPPAGVEYPTGVTVDTTHAELLVLDGPAVVSYPRTGDEGGPLRILAGPSTGLENDPRGIAWDPLLDEIYVASADSITVYPRSASGDTAPTRTLGAPKSEAGLVRAVTSIAFDAVNREIVVTVVIARDIFVLDYSEILVYASDASGGSEPMRRITRPARGLAGVAVDAWNDEILVVRTDAVDVYGRTACGEAAPLRVITGLATGLNHPEGIAVDPANDEIFVANSAITAPVGAGRTSSVTVYGRTENGNVAPLRTIAGGQTWLRRASGIALAP